MEFSVFFNKKTAPGNIVCNYIFENIVLAVICDHVDI